MVSVRRLRNDIIFVGDVTVLSSFRKKTNSNLIASSKRSALAATVRRSNDAFFPQATHILCTRHLIENARENLCKNYTQLTV
jgi:hypothetical protein